ncbi:hypothetical protein ST201phi2-1p372 [Pseudomonas phage 201phi2-1]|uniref:Uncharacterized protein n=1 Tax=Pseudomonas phage 201phi2-1 TaxID=198110 RepID=B3FJN2_BP201|nr:hypothetical protein ST201phi2-1p372 [Pseudomonas phage 201phi2-1]ABY63197.1 hypothetical protein 201phi2-1p372 [Pseudomonas phage 201phi2-1]
MKTAIVPNDPGLTRLMEVNAELSVALEQYENHFRGEVVRHQFDAVSSSLKAITDRLPNLSDQELRIIEAGVADAVHNASEYTVEMIGLHERTLGLTSETAPAEIAKSANTIFGQRIAKYWDDV